MKEKMIAVDVPVIDENGLAAVFRIVGLEV